MIHFTIVFSKLFSEQLWRYNILLAYNVNIQRYHLNLLLMLLPDARPITDVEGSVPVVETAGTMQLIKFP